MWMLLNDILNDYKQNPILQTQTPWSQWKLSSLVLGWGGDHRRVTSYFWCDTCSCLVKFTWICIIYSLPTSFSHFCSFLQHKILEYMWVSQDWTWSSFKIFSSYFRLLKFILLKFILFHTMSRSNSIHINEWSRFTTEIPPTCSRKLICSLILGFLGVKFEIKNPLLMPTYN